ncbi:MAG: rod shape-determining protein MreC [Syntrophobacteraceae bacterium CG2_30_61_12]|nr:MAG: rod shape-determining protein MreC [Syntrophobacteraceae bacterium CG2_30_61_12]PIU32819.1 MAG: rod shape-determining protein MreC [Syntrophobacteraceae bacterium CG07_land_8_20_14_0_80_61_8]
MIEWLRRLRGLFLALALLAILLYVFTLNFQAPTDVGLFRRLVIEVFSPVLNLLHSSSRSIDEKIKGYVVLRQVRQDNEQLRGQINELQNKLTAYQEAFLENQRLRRLLDFKNTLGVKGIASQVVVHDPSGWFQTVVIDKGSREGIKTDMAVVNEEGVVGRIAEVSDHYSRVILITDPESAVDALVQRNRTRGIMTGKDEKSCLLRYVRGNLDVRTGDLVITSGKDGIFPKGLRLGIVREVVKDPVDLFQTIALQPIVNPNYVEELLVIGNHELPPDNWQETQSDE